jgi:CHASE1-domain containing sensor protein
MLCLYTKDELITKIQAIDTKLEASIMQSKLDTNQASQSFTRENKYLQEQRDRYYTMLMQFYPDDYSNVIVLSTNRRGNNGLF